MDPMCVDHKHTLLCFFIRHNSSSISCLLVTHFQLICRMLAISC